MPRSPLASAGRPDPDTVRPRLLSLRDPDAEAELSALVAASPGLQVHDEIAAQVRGLLETRDPAGTLDPGALAAQVREVLGDDPDAYGMWAYYPWSRRLVHVLPEAEFRELRTSRNRNKITAAEQARLQSLHIGIVGLSIGAAAAVTLTLEGIGGLLVLADFDHLELSNLNRLRSGVHGLGVNKAVLAAREVAEIDPYTHVQAWTGGVDGANVDGFLTAGGRPLDLVYEECDDIAAKFLVRERARSLRIPVLMETSDRGLMDVERFDLEPDRPLFHGLAAGVRTADLAGMTTSEKVPLILRIVGREGMSARMAASMVDVAATLKSWPQLASEVALGAGLNVDTARRIALGELTTSGRFYVDPHAVIRDGAAVPLPAPEDEEIGVSPEAAAPDLPPLRRSAAVDDQTVRTLVAWATRAPSGGNCQPWTFGFDGERLSLHHDPRRSEGTLDVDGRASQLAFGAVLENVALVCPALGLRPRFVPYPDPADPTHVCDVLLAPEPGVTAVDPLVSAIPARVTNRRIAARRPLDPAHRERMSEAARRHGCDVRWLEDPADLDAVAAVLGRVDRVRMLSRTMHTEMMAELRWSPAEVERTRDGLDVATLELAAPDLAGMKVIRSWPVMRAVGAVGGGAGLERPTRKAVAGASAVGLLTVPGVDAAAFLRAGRALQRLWLAATADEVAFQPMTAATYLFHRLVHGGGVGLAEAERRELAELRREHVRLFGVPEGHGEPMLFRVGYAPPPTAHSLRRDVDDVLTISRSPGSGAAAAG